MTCPVVPVIHIVDDDASFRKSLARLLETAGFSSLGYASGTEILASARLEELGCVLVDLQMPGLDGLELQQRLAEMAREAKARGTGCIAFLRKPFSGESLIGAVNRALAGDLF